jgi:hypothetical protein
MVLFQLMVLIGAGHRTEVAIASAVGVTFTRHWQRLTMDVPSAEMKSPALGRAGNVAGELFRSTGQSLARSFCQSFSNMAVCRSACSSSFSNKDSISSIFSACTSATAINPCIRSREASIRTKVLSASSLIEISWSVLLTAGNLRGNPRIGQLGLLRLLGLLRDFSSRDDSARKVTIRRNSMMRRSRQGGWFVVVAGELFERGYIMSTTFRFAAVSPWM